jgi:hypothetical protein
MRISFGTWNHSYFSLIVIISSSYLYLHIFSWSSAVELYVHRYGNITINIVFRSARGFSIYSMSNQSWFSGTMKFRLLTTQSEHAVEFRLIQSCHKLDTLPRHMLGHFPSFCSGKSTMYESIAHFLWVRPLDKHSILAMNAVFGESFHFFSFPCSFHIAIEVWTILFEFEFNSVHLYLSFELCLREMYTLFGVKKYSFPAGFSKAVGKGSNFNPSHEILIESLSVIYFDFKNNCIFIWYSLGDWLNRMFHEFVICWIAYIDDWADFASL